MSASRDRVGGVVCVVLGVGLLVVVGAGAGGALRWGVGVVLGLGIVRVGVGVGLLVGVATGDGRLTVVREGTGRLGAGVGAAAGADRVGRGLATAAARYVTRVAARSPTATACDVAAARCIRSPQRADASAGAASRLRPDGAAAPPPIGTRLAAGWIAGNDVLATLSGAEEASSPQERTAAPSVGATRRRRVWRAGAGQGAVGATRLLQGTSRGRPPRARP